MDISGHNELSEVGSQILNDALTSGNKVPLRTGAFYLGNWLRDVSQFIDPVAYRKARVAASSIATRIEALFGRFVNDAASRLPKEGHVRNMVLLELEELRNRLEQARYEALKRIDAFLAVGGNQKTLGETFRAVFRFIGYCKFVVPDDGTDKRRMDEVCYFALFDKLYSQYFPHEHLDRPEVRSGQYAIKKADGPLNLHTDRTVCQGDLYAYMREGIKVAAGTLAYLDGGIEYQPPRVSWAIGTFNPQFSSFTDAEGLEHPVSDEDLAWNEHLALLGMSLHCIEDFFAHSTFVEHASTAIPHFYKPFSRLEDAVIIEKRTKEWVPGFDDDRNDWRKLQKDTHIVTGYFDPYDTLISILHAMDKAFDRPQDKLSRTADAAVEYEYKKLLTDTLELWDQPQRELANENNLAVKELRKKHSTALSLLERNQLTLNRFAWLISETSKFKGFPESAKQSFRDSVIGLGQVVGAVSLSISLYRLLKNIAELLTDPLAFLVEYFPETVKLLKEYREVYVKDMIYQYLGAGRIGCHSLIAKDGGLEVLHHAAMECAKAVHWYAVFTMTRHARNTPCAVARCGNANRVTRNALYAVTWIDWLELLEYFLGHPLAQAHSHQGVSVSVADGTDRARKWWYPIILNGWREILTSGCHAHVVVPHKEQVRLWDESQDLRVNLQKQYNAL